METAMFLQIDKAQVGGLVRERAVHLRRGVVQAPAQRRRHPGREAGSRFARTR